ncbi:uncharacterized protein B0H64DRAFT_202190 [Chaetomium fimeti]|uniref:Uncharacterized protein n=1 Tax=Chaetomium fimeti TaxID=1854472 RepID=A0AAE0HAK2_9PEZI|nr:hypothetical protein B0H64DRAFT_202190 [Chaetomium fimeti]
MCKVRVVHFLTHDARVLMATDPFSDRSEPGDFIAPTITGGCPQACVDSLVKSQAQNPALERFDPCDQHDCCVTTQLSVRCQRFLDHPGQLGPWGVASETECPNHFIINECHPIATVLRDVPVPPGARWGTKNAPPYFPATELFYSSTITAATVPDEESNGLYNDRTQFQLLGVELAMQKEILEHNIKFATDYMGSLERKFNDLEGLKALATKDELRLARRFVAMAKFAEREAARIYQQMMQRTGFVLTMLNRMPDPGQSVTVADGLFSISRERLDLGGLDYQAVIDACDGPLKRSVKLRHRLKKITTAIKALKKTRTKRKMREGARKEPVLASHGMQ